MCRCLNSGAARMLPGVGEVGPQAAGPSSGEGNLKKEPQKNVCIFGLNSYRILVWLYFLIFLIHMHIYCRPVRLSI
jgi:hypothetical protein